MWTYLRERLAKDFKLTRITDRSQEGVADVVYLHRASRIAGWLELKALSYLPTKSKLGLLGYAELRQDQSIFLNDWARNNGHAGVLLRVGLDRWYYWRALGNHSWASDIRSWPTEDAIRYANGKWDSVLDVEMLTQCMISDDGFAY